MMLDRLLQVLGLTPTPRQVLTLNYGRGLRQSTLIDRVRSPLLSSRVLW